MIRVGIAGLGGMGTMHARCYAALPNTKIVAGADLQPDRREKLAKSHDVQLFSSYQEMCESAEIDVVDICLPTYLHAEAATAFAQAKRHLLCEKPMALSVAGCDAMIAAAQKAGVQLMIAQVLRFMPDYALVKEIVDSGRFGRVLSVSAARVGGGPKWGSGNWFGDPKLSGGAILDLHVHDVDFVGCLLGRPTLVSAAGTFTEHDGIDTSFTTMTGFPGGAVAFAETSWTRGPKFPFATHLRVDLEGGSVALSPRSPTGVLVCPADGGAEHPEPAKPEAGGAVAVGVDVTDLGGYLLEVQYFVNCIEKGETPARVPPESSRQAVQICLAAAQSIRTGQPVTL